MMNDINSKEQTPASILMVDDVPKNIQLLASILSQEGYSIFASTNGKQALESVESSPPDLILLDVNMPEMDGYETCRRLKASPQFKDIPIIFLTAKTETEDIVKGFELGAVDYVIKPFNAAELLSRVRTHLEMKHNREIIQNQSHQRKELIHVLCHDLLNPICSLEGFLELIYMDNSKLLEFKDYLFISLQNCKNIIDLVRNYKSLEENKSNLVLENCNLKELLNESLVLLRSKIIDKSLEVVLDIDPQLNVQIERTSFINSVLNNILSNAIKFSYQGSRIDISASQENSTVTIILRDYGLGMSKKLVHDIFDLNKKTNRQGTNGEQGTGFGMPLVKKYMSAFGGSIDIKSKEKDESDLDHGTSVILKF